MAKPDQNVKTLLDQWGRWKVRENSLAVGYPSMAAFARLRVDGDRRESNELLIDDDLMRCNEVVNGLRPALKRVIVCHYITAGHVKHKPALLQVSRVRYFEMLDAAIKQVAHELGGKYQIEREEAVPA